MTIGKKILRLRKEKGLSQEDLAQKLNVSRQAISKWELGENAPDIEKIKTLSELFNVSIDLLVNDNNEEVIIIKNTKKNNDKLIISSLIVFSLFIGIFVGYAISNEQNNKKNLFLYEKSMNIITDASIEASNLNNYGLFKLSMIPSINLEDYEISFFAIDYNKNIHELEKPVIYKNSIYTADLTVPNNQGELYHSIEIYVKISKGKSEVTKKLYSVYRINSRNYDFTTYWK